MQFFLFDVALAFVTLLGYRTLIRVVRRRAPVVWLDGRLQPRRKPVTARPRRRERPPHRLINFW
jgi:hypothetical protein